MPKVLNIRDFNYRTPDRAIYVGRAVLRYGLSASKWGNPMTIRALKELFPSDTPLELQEKAVSWFREYITTPFGRPAELMEQIGELKGKDLVCWCHTWDGQGSNPMYCHADVLLELANQSA